MYDYKRHLISSETQIKDALELLNNMAPDPILFVVDPSGALVGSLTDGDVRRGMIKGFTLESSIRDFIQASPKCILKSGYSLTEIIELREEEYGIIPVVDENKVIVNAINFRYHRSYLPVDAVIMAGGRGSRLSPITNTIPKPMVKVGEKPIIEHNVDRLASFGIDDMWLSIGYMGDQIQSYLGDGSEQNIHIQYIKESKPLGTIGAVRSVEGFQNDFILVINSDILTNIDYEDFFLDFVSSGADISVVAIPYKVQVPYAVLETQNGQISSFSEKPTYTYYSNGGIYLMKREILPHIPKEEFFNATDLLQVLIDKGDKVVSYPLRSYWLDIGNHEDLEKAKDDIAHIRF